MTGMLPVAGYVPARRPGETAWGLTTLGLKLTGDPRISLLLTAVWAVAPGSVVLTMLYAEALFCALAGWALVALVSRRWLTAGMLTLAAGTVRSTAVALIAAVAVVVITAFATSANWISSKPRFVLPAMLLALPAARLLAPLRTSALVPLVGVLAVAIAWFGLYLTVIAVDTLATRTPSILGGRGGMAPLA
ncbi:MAG TPA: hypothetical protein VFQ68_05855 [Streptosporangiaceae bacterium]|nr:hypothetical protein [Streptosporangiaceae bacterium]